MTTVVFQIVKNTSENKFTVIVVVITSSSSFIRLSSRLPPPLTTCLILPSIVVVVVVVLSPSSRGRHFKLQITAAARRKQKTSGNVIVMSAFSELSCLRELHAAVMTVLCRIVQRSFTVGHRQHRDFLANDLGNFPILTHHVLEDLSHDVIAAIDSRIRLVLFVFGYSVAREPTDFMAIYDIGGSDIIIIIIIVIDRP